MSEGARRARRDWTSVREWANLAVAVVALLVAIVSVWTTTQISGVEDYFRSEIARRNSDLNALSDQARRVRSLADERERHLTRLQATTEEVTASNLAAQGKLLTTQQELSRLSFAVLGARQTIASSKARLASLAEESNRQASLNDLYRRRRFLELADRRLFYEGIREDQHDKVMDGEAAYQVITNWSVGSIDADLAAYLPTFLQNARNTCEWIRSYKPRIPTTLPAPGDYPRGNALLQKEWFARWEAYSASQTRSLEAAEKASFYVTHAGTSCMCRALATIDHPASAICGDRATAPASPPS